MRILEDVLKELDGALERVQIKREPYDVFINYKDFPFSDGRTLMYLGDKFILVDYERGSLSKEQASLSKDYYRQTFIENQLKLWSKISLEYALWKKQEISERLKRFSDLKKR